MAAKRATRAAAGRARRLRGLALIALIGGLFVGAVLLFGPRGGVRLAGTRSDSPTFGAIAASVLCLLPALFFWTLARWRESVNELAALVARGSTSRKERRAKLRAALGPEGRGLQTIGGLLVLFAAIALAALASSNGRRAIALAFGAWLPGALFIALGRWRAAAAALKRRADGAARAPVEARDAAAPSGPPPRWLLPSEPCTVAGFSIAGGMLYVGSDPFTHESTGAHEGAEAHEPSLVDPTLAVERGDPDRAGTRLRAGKSYADLHPASRAAYLEWLAGGRRDARAHAGYLFLFYSGLERRLCIDGEAGLVTLAEAEALERELRRLATLHATQRAFRRAAASLADFAAVRFLAERELEPPALDASTDEGAPARLWLGLGRFAARSEPIPAAWARAWLAYASDEALPSAARRAPDEFERLFRARLPAGFGADLAARAQRTGVVARHEAQSSALRGRSFEASAPVPNLAQLRKPLQQLVELARACGEELEPWARWLARHPDERPDLAALASLPRELLERRDDAPLETLRRTMDEALRDASVALVDERALLRALPAAHGKPSARDASSLARVLGKLGCGLEPDVRFGGPRLGAGDRCALFRLSDDAPHAPSRAYSAATLVLHLAALVSQADGATSEGELARLETMLDETLELAGPERERLHAHRLWLLARPLELRGLKKRVEALELGERERIARFLVAVACADGRVDPAEVRMLERLYSLLVLEPSAVHRDLHAAGIAQDEGLEPSHVTEPLVGGVASAGTARRSVELDGALVRRKLAETAKVSSLLAGIFASDEDGVQDAPAPSQQGAEQLAGLDAPHSAFLRAFAERASWPRGEVEELAARFGLLPEGALDTLNDAAWDRCEAPLWEGDDPIEIDRTTAEELFS